MVLNIKDNNIIRLLNIGEAKSNLKNKKSMTLEKKVYVMKRMLNY